MKLVLVLLAFVGICTCNPAVSEDHTKDNDEQRQKDIFRLFHHIHQPSFYKDHVDIAANFHFHENASLFDKPEVVEHFQRLFRYGSLLEKGAIFSTYYYEHLHQAESLFLVFYHAKTYETFYKAAVWARQHVNEGLFVYAFSVALVHRPDTQHLLLPPIYEIFPHYFFSNEVIQKAQYHKQLHQHDQVVHSNYSGHYLNLNEEQSLGYFTEDVGVNAWNYYYNIYYPSWLEGEHFGIKERRGEVFLHRQQQFLARYYLERLSHNFGDVQRFDWESPLEVGFYPDLHYQNGLEFPSRHDHVDLRSNSYLHGQKVNVDSHYAESYTEVQDFERRFRDAVFGGYYFSRKGDKVELSHEDGVNVLGNLIDGNPDSHYYPAHGSYGSYEIYAHHLLGYARQPLNYHHAHPSALEHHETEVRDPAYYQFSKRILEPYYKYLFQRKPYSEHDLEFKGVHVKSVEFDRLVTYFDEFHADLSNAVYVNEEEFHKDLKIRVEQQRLKHKPFFYKIHVVSEKDADVAVKVFLGPKHDEFGRHINLTENFENFVQFDHFHYHLKQGENVISKNSEDIVSYLHDREGFHGKFEKVHHNFDKSESFQVDSNQILYGFPQGLYLPHGAHDGVAYQFFVFVYPAQGNKDHHGRFVDGQSLFYPFDRPVYEDQVFHDLSNGYFHEEKVYHRSAEDVEANASH